MNDIQLANTFINKYNNKNAICIILHTNHENNILDKSKKIEAHYCKRCHNVTTVKYDSSYGDLCTQCDSSCSTFVIYIYTDLQDKKYYIYENNYNYTLIYKICDNSITFSEIEDYKLFIYHNNIDTDELYITQINLLTSMIDCVENINYMKYI